MRVKFIWGLLLILPITLASCNNDKNDANPITLSYEDNDYVFDNEARHINVYPLSETLPMRITGGDGNFSITNYDEDIIGYTLDGNILKIYGISIGSGSIKVSDTSNNSYTLKVTVSNNYTQPPFIYSLALVYSDNMDEYRKTTLENKIVADATTGRLEFSTVENGKEVILKFYFTDTEDSEYKEYTYISMPFSEIPPQYYQPILFPAQILGGSILKSDEEELVMFICKPFHLEDGKMIRGNNLILDVTHRYILEYPEIRRAYEVRTSFPVN